MFFFVDLCTGHFPKVEYLECLPTLQEGRDIPTYDATLCAFASGQLSLNTLLTRMEMSVERCRMTPERVKEILTPRYVVDMVLLYQESRRRSGLQQKRKIILVSAPILPISFCSPSFHVIFHYSLIFVLYMRIYPQHFFLLHLSLHNY